MQNAECRIQTRAAHDANNEELGHYLACRRCATPINAQRAAHDQTNGDHEITTTTQTGKMYCYGGMAFKIKPAFTRSSSCEGPDKNILVLCNLWSANAGLLYSCLDGGARTVSRRTKPAVWQNVKTMRTKRPPNQKTQKA